MNAQTEKLFFNGECGSIEALLDRPPAGVKLQGLAIISHPNPVAGGDMHHKVVQTIAKAALTQGWLALRYNYRGVGASSGAHSDGSGELRDLQAVLAQAAMLNPSPLQHLLLAGFSFGTFITSMALQESTALCEQTQGLILVGTAVGKFDVPVLPESLRSKTLMIHGQDDDIVPIEPVMQWVGEQNLPILIVPQGGHFFHGQQATLKDWMLRFLEPLKNINS